MTRRIELVHGPERPRDPKFVEAFERLDRIAALEQDWDGHGALALPRAAIDRARQLLRRCEVIGDCVAPFVTMYSAGILLEWGDHVLDVELGENSLVVRLDRVRNGLVLRCRGSEVERNGLDFAVRAARQFSHARKVQP